MKLERIANTIFATVIIALLWGLMPIEEPTVTHYAWRIILSIALFCYGCRYSFMRLPQQLWFFLKSVTKRYNRAMMRIAGHLFEYDPDIFETLANHSIHLVECSYDLDTVTANTKRIDTILRAWQAYGQRLTLAGILNLASSLVLGELCCNLYPNWGYIIILLYFLTVTWLLSSLFPTSERCDKLEENFALFASSILSTAIISLVYFIINAVQAYTSPSAEPSAWCSPVFRLQLNFATIPISYAHLTLIALFCLMLFTLVSIRNALSHILQLRKLIELEYEQYHSLILCPICNGSGISESQHCCTFCQGTGVVDIDHLNGEDDEEEEEEEEEE